MAESTLAEFYADVPNKLCPACVEEWDEWLRGVADLKEKRRIERALRDPQSHDFRSVHPELYFHHLLVSQGADINWHPELSGTSHRPEFLVDFNGEQFLFESRLSEMEKNFVEQDEFCRLLKPLLVPLVNGPFFVVFSTGQVAPPLSIFSEI